MQNSSVDLNHFPEELIRLISSFLYADDIENLRRLRSHWNGVIVDHVKTAQSNRLTNIGELFSKYLNSPEKLGKVQGILKSHKMKDAKNLLQVRSTLIDTKHLLVEELKTCDWTTLWSMSEPEYLQKAPLFLGNGLLADVSKEKQKAFDSQQRFYQRLLEGDIFF